MCLSLSALLLSRPLAVTPTYPHLPPPGSVFAQRHVAMRLAANGGAATHHRAAAQLHGARALAHGVGVPTRAGIPQRRSKRE